MNWFRSHARLGSCLALFALAFQLAVSFGHVHAHQITPRATALPSDIAAAATTAHELALSSSHAGDDHALADDHCPVCALIHLARTLVQAEAPSLPLPGGFGPLRLETVADFIPRASAHALFHARAPPLA